MRSSFLESWALTMQAVNRSSLKTPAGRGDESTARKVGLRIHVLQTSGDCIDRPELWPGTEPRGGGWHRPQIQAMKSTLEIKILSVGRRVIR